MAKTYANRGQAAVQSLSSQSTETSLPPIIRHGLVQHPLLSGGVQIRVLAKIDASGSALVADVVTLLSGHADPIGAIFVLLDAGIIVAELKGRPMDEDTILRRPWTPDAPALAIDPPHDDDDGDAGASALAFPTEPVGSSRPAFSPVMARLDWSQRRDLGRGGFWCRPGIYLLASCQTVYVGASAELNVRAVQGSQPISQIDTLLMLADANGELDFEDALALERLMHMRLSACRDLTLANGTPDGTAIMPDRFDDLQVLAGQFALFLARESIGFAGQSSRNILAGPRMEKGFTSTLRIFDEMPKGEIHELAFNSGLQARAVHHESGDWIVLRDSEIRIETVRSANSTASYHRSALLHAGVLVPSVNGGCYLLKRDLRFPSRSAAAHFVTGSKGQGRGGWKPIDPEGGFDPNTNLLIAS